MWPSFLFSSKAALVVRIIDQDHDCMIMVLRVMRSAFSREVTNFVSPLLLNLLLPPLALVEVCKVVADDGDGQGDHEHPADGAHRANNLARTQITLCALMLGQKQCLLV